MSRQAEGARFSVGPSDDGERAEFGVNASVITAGEDRIRLVFDDVAQGDSSQNRAWEHRCFYTSIELDRQVFEESALSDQELAAIGQALVARLTALRRVNNPG